MSLKFIMSQFGYAEERGENKARADIYAVISPPPIPPASPKPQWARVAACYARGRVLLHMCCGVSYSVIYMKTTQRRDDVRNEADKKGARAAHFPLYDVNGFNLITGCFLQLVLIFLSLALPLALLCRTLLLSQAFQITVKYYSPWPISN